MRPRDLLFVLWSIVWVAPRKSYFAELTSSLSSSKDGLKRRLQSQSSRIVRGAGEIVAPIQHYYDEVKIWKLWEGFVTFTFRDTSPNTQLRLGKPEISCHNLDSS